MSFSFATIASAARTFTCIALVGALLSPISANAQTPTGKLGGQYLPIDGVVTGVLQPAKVMTSDATKLYPMEIAEAWCLDNVGISPADCESIRVVVASPGPSGPMAGIIFKLTRPVTMNELNPQIVRADAAGEVDGHTVYPINGPPGVVMHQADPSTIVVASENYLDSLLKAADGSGTGTLAQLASAVSHDGHLSILVAIEPVRPMINGLLQTVVDQIPPPLAPFTELPNLLDAVLLRVNLEDSENGVQLVMLARDDSAAQEIEQLLADGVQMGRQMAMAEMENNLQGEGAVPDATRAYATRIADKISAMLKPERSGRRLTMSTSPSQGLAVQAMMVGLLAPAVQGARGAARRAQSSNNMKMIGLAMHNYHSAYRQLPLAVNRDEAGKPLLSWRVHVLPFIEEQALYQQFRLDEPWDSDHNIKLLDQMPAVFKHPRMQVEPNKTVYQVPVGEGLMFSKDGPTRFRDVMDGLSNTIMTVQTDAESAVEWTRPQDWEPNMENPWSGLGVDNGTTSIGLGDGAVLQLSEQTDPDMLRKMLTRAGKEVVNF
ncbi:MAG: DUF1559 domain-containing protein [Pirellulaceae bacterium]|nr:DUF1559 domain-containing protein [Pirellulaceae bacterium]